MSQEHFNKLTPGESERLARLAEECAEVVQIVCKIQRHGYMSYNPFDANKVPNVSLLEKEIGHVQQAINALIEREDIYLEAIVRSRDAKAESVKEYLHHQ